MREKFLWLFPNSKTKHVTTGSDSIDMTIVKKKKDRQLHN